jgi:hypothetical protein
MNEQKQDKQNDEIAQLLMGVALIGFSVVALMVLLSNHVAEVLGRAY